MCLPTPLSWLETEMYLILDISLKLLNSYSKILSVNLFGFLCKVKNHNKKHIVQSSSPMKL